MNYSSTNNWSDLAQHFSRLDGLVDREKIISIGEEIFSKSIDISGEKNEHKLV